jgi:hypothetical protein
MLHQHWRRQVSSHRWRMQAQYRVQMKRDERKEDRPDVAAVARRIPRRAENRTGGDPLLNSHSLGQEASEKKNSEAADMRLAQESDDGGCCEKKSCEKKKCKNTRVYRSVSGRTEATTGCRLTGTPRRENDGTHTDGTRGRQKSATPA